MRKITLTCPFTGLPFEALEFSDGKISFKHALTGEEIHMNWNPTIERYNIRKNAFSLIETVTFSEAAEILDVTPQRITQIARDNVIRAYNISGKHVFLKHDILEYRDNRKVGAPRKVKENGAGNN